MQRALDRLGGDEFDLLVVGGGITGACIAHDAALRGLSVALVEKRDFGGATSAASSKLLHGGIRYLQTLQFWKVRESAQERTAFLRIAPHLVRWVPFLIPTYEGLRKGRALLTAGMAAYELICAGHDRDLPARLRPPRGRFLTRDEIAREVPALERPTLTGAHVLYEAHMQSSERMTLAFLKTASRNGAAIANYVEVEDFLVSGSRVCGAAVRDVLSDTRFEVRARVTVNAAGPWIPALNRRLAVGRLPRPITHYSKGAHIVTKAITKEFAIALPSSRQGASIVSRGGRHVFVIPWRGRSLIGTSDSPFRDELDAVVPGEPDIQALLEDVHAALPGARLDRSDVAHAFAGLYPLTGDEVQPHIYRGSGAYQIADHARQDGVDGFMSVVGAKYTTARRLAAFATNVVLRKLGRTVEPCRTAEAPLVGFVAAPAEHASALVRAHRDTLDPATAAYLAAHYGAEADAVLQAGSHRRLAPERESVEAEAAFAAREEMAVRLEDLVFRRTGLGTVGHPGLDCLRRCAEIMGGQLGWTEDEIERQVRETHARFAVRPAGGSHAAPHRPPAPLRSSGNS